MSAAPAQHARYRWIDPADLVHLSPKDVAAYRAERRRFDADVAGHVEHALTRLRAAADLQRDRLAAEQIGSDVKAKRSGQEALNFGGSQ